MICPLKAPSSNTRKYTKLHYLHLPSLVQSNGSHHSLKEVEKKPLFDVKVTRGSDVDSDYHHVIGMFEMKLAQEYSDDNRRY